MTFEKFDINDAIRHFPGKDFRKYQKEAIIEITEAFNSGCRAILLDSPTGSGKSLLNTSFTRLFKNSFYTTPQLTLIDQILRDPLINRDYVEIKGRQNYICVKDKPQTDFEGKKVYVTVDIGKCIRSTKFKCHDKNYVCPYYVQKKKALASKKTIMSLAYFLAEGNLREMGFGNRELLVLDESHSLDESLINYVTFEISSLALNRSLYNLIKPPSRLNTDDETSVKLYVTEAVNEIEYEVKDLMALDETMVELAIWQIKLRDKLRDFIFKAKAFIDGNFDSWVCSTKQNQRGTELVFEAKPIYASPFGPHLIWNRANYFIISSATLLETLIKETGLDRVLAEDEIHWVKVPSTFPPENRPIVPMLAGKLTHALYDKNVIIAVQQLEKAFDIEKDVNFVVHCHSYKNSRKILELLNQRFYSKIISHSSFNREIKLQEFIEKGKFSPHIFLSVAFGEGQNWIGGICEAQALFKIPYPHIQDERVKRRLELNQWNWYFSETLKHVIQAYGRAVRTPTDTARFYVIDSSFVDLISRTRKIMPDWFEEVLPEEWGSKPKPVEFTGERTIPPIMRWKPDVKTT